MACGAPLTAYRPATGGPIHFNNPRNGRAYVEIQIPCGQCILCRLEHARQWAVRITHEAQQWETSSFITLTYEDANLPAHNSLDYSHLQKFWKRLRKQIGKLRYFAVGEYGDETNRPHYHACVFGHDWAEGRRLLRSTPNPLWTHKDLEEAWGKGNVSVGALTFQTAQYTASYVTKKLNNKRQYVRLDDATGELIPLVQPRAFMSLKPAIGREWLEKHGNAVYAWDHVVIEGRIQKPPKYYDKWLKGRSEIAEGMIKEERLKRAEKKTPEQLRARAENAHARTKAKVKVI